MYKYAKSRNGALGQSVGTTIHQGLAGVPVVGPYIGATDSIGTLIGLMSSSSSDKALNRYDRTVGVDVIPGAAGFRAARRRKRLSRDLGGSPGRAWGQILGPWLAPSLLAIAGSVTGGFFGDTPEQKAKNAIIGMGVGSGVGALGNLTGAITAASTKTRDREAQKKYQQSRGQGVMNWLLPGVGQYNKWKSRGHMIRGKGYRDQEDFQKSQEATETKKQKKTEDKQVTKQASLQAIKNAYRSYYKRLVL